nr:hypothetical protein [Tanacetum cinerariifolium]
CDTKDAIKEGAAKIYNLVTGADIKEARTAEPNSNDSTSCASSSSNEVEIESNVGTSIQEPIIVQDLPSFSCNSSNKNENSSRTSCNKNSYFNKKAGHFRKHASPVSKLCFVCGSGTHLIKDCDFYEKPMANKTVGIGVGLVHCKNKVNHQNQFVPQAVLLRTGKVNIPPARPQPVPTGKRTVFAPVPYGRQNRPFSVPTDRGYSPSPNGSRRRISAFQVLYMDQRMLTHKLEIDTDVVGNDMTTAEQLIQFIKNQLAAAQASSV